ncbi:D-2-hydroxyglutarate dehydrogenase, mitochondrial-like [Haematobia irritans]|uniref:D-2-hydroxyglutarate dehydrogenase, mitochondrial-like n=1 Tax=Haematobia irritans TaxID=7368 RepID=UPI003F4F58AC
MIRFWAMKRNCSFLLTTLRTYKTSGLPELTPIRHNVKRGNYGELQDKDVGFFESLIGSTNILQDGQDDLQGYNVDCLRSVRGGSKLVLANGQVMDLMSDFKKDNTGYHLKHLFIGSEGTLGVVTKLAILCPAVSESVHVAFLGLNSFEAVLRTLKNAKRNLGEVLSSCEMIDASALASSVENFNLKSPLAGYPFYMLIETSGSNAEHDMEKLNNFLQFVMEKGDVIDGTYTNEPSKILEIWKLRELIGPACTKDGYCFKYDISLPLRSFYDIVQVVNKQAGHVAKRVCGYGHLGDLNLHLNVSCDEYSPKLHKLLEPFVYEYTAQLKGSISAEHGIGFLKTKYLKHSKSPEAIAMMRDMKKMLDPNGILNPYKVLN